MKCTICTYPLLIRGFYLFPCQHSFHIDCLVNDVSSTLVLEMEMGLCTYQYCDVSEAFNY